MERNKRMSATIKRRTWIAIYWKRTMTDHNHIFKKKCEGYERHVVMKDT